MGKKYSHDMSQESEGGAKALLPEGIRVFKISVCEEQVSKSGNEMFKFTWIDVLTRQETEVYAISVPKKRWFLKSILAACDIQASEDGVYDWDIDDVLDMFIKGRVEHYDDEWINKDNRSVVTKKYNIVDIDSCTSEEASQAQSQDIPI